MTMNLIAGLLGLIFMTLSKMQGVKKDFEVANQPFVLKKFFSGELIAILMSLVVIVLMAITVQEWMKVSPKVADYVTIIFAMGGAIGSWAFLLFLGKSKKYIRNVIDIKTNIADGLPVPEKKL
jgi:hypothetical protein